MRTGPTDGSPADSYLREISAVLWPGSSLTGRADRRARYVILPSAGRPKLIVARRPLRLAASTVRNYNTGSTRRERLGIVGLSAAVRAGLADLLPARMHVPEGPDIRAELSRVLGRPVDVGLYIGPPRAVRKPVLQVLDHRGRTLAFAKLGVDEFTRNLVRTEAEAVAALARAPLRALVVPSLLHHGQWNGHELLVQRAMARGDNADAGDPLLGRAMDELARSRGTDTGELGASAYWRSLVDRLGRQPATALTERLQRSVTLVRGRSEHANVEFGSWHGDWAPWNMTVSGGRVSVWDWEKFESGVPLGFDAIHYSVHGATARTGVSPHESFSNTLARAPELLAVHGIEPATALLVFWLYVLELAVRYLEDAEMSAGTTAMSRMQEWLEPVLSEVEAATDTPTASGDPT